MADKQVDIRCTEDSVAIGDPSGNLVTITGNRLDVNAVVGGGPITANIQDSAGNPLGSTAGSLNVAQNALNHATDSVTARIQDGAGSALTSVLDGAAQRLHVATQAAIEAAEGPNFPRREIVRTAVQAGDIGADYVAGSQGQVKTEKMYPQGAAPGSPAKLTTYKYQDASFPTFCTLMIETSTTV